MRAKISGVYRHLNEGVFSTGYRLLCCFVTLSITSNLLPVWLQEDHSSTAPTPTAAISELFIARHNYFADFLIK
jgi:hypothetical protein